MTVVHRAIGPLGS